MDDERGVISGTEFDLFRLWGKLAVGPKNKGDSLPKLKLSAESRSPRVLGWDNLTDS